VLAPIVKMWGFNYLMSSSRQLFHFYSTPMQKGWKQAATQRVQPDLWLFEQGFA